jgi:hypothetical protein
MGLLRSFVALILAVAIEVSVILLAGVADTEENVYDAKVDADDSEDGN